MADRYTGSITVGGELKRNHVERLCQAIVADAPQLNWGDALFEPERESELIAAVHDGWLWVCDEEAIGGEFEEIEEACRELGLSYIRFSEEYGDIDPERVDWRPDMKSPLVRHPNASGREVLVLERDVRMALDVLRSGDAKRAERMLGKLCVDVPQLPKFQIV